MILIYSPYISNRLRYVCQYFWENEYLLTDSVQKIASWTESKINYSQDELPGSLHIEPSGLLAETGLSPIEIDTAIWDQEMILFPTNGDFRFDIFSASFYLMSRYEEYLDVKTDHYGRYDGTHSIAFKNDFLRRPVVDIWFQMLESALKKQFSEYQSMARKFKYLPTFDIDVAYSYLHKNIFLTIGGLVKSLFKKDLYSARKRLKVLLGKVDDPYDTYPLIENELTKCGLNCVFFFLMAEKIRGHDRNISPHQKAQTQLIKAMAQRHDVGIHPSWQSGDKFSVLEREIQLLAAIAEEPITKSRQHYIRMELPRTYRELIQCGITEDYSMGYGELNGFRASVARPFFWYDISQEQVTNLLLHPFCWMDATVVYAQKESPENALAELLQYVQTVQAVHGQLVTIMHNNYFSSDPPFTKWREMLLRFFAVMAEKDKIKV